MGFGVWSLGFGGLGFGVWGFGFRAYSRVGACQGEYCLLRAPLLGGAVSYERGTPVMRANPHAIGRVLLAPRSSVGRETKAYEASREA